MNNNLLSIYSQIGVPDTRSLVMNFHVRGEVLNLTKGRTIRGEVLSLTKDRTMNSEANKIRILKVTPFDKLRANEINQSFLKLDWYWNSYLASGFLFLFLQPTQQKLKITLHTNKIIKSCTNDDPT